MKVGKRNVRRLKVKDGQKLRFREIGKSFIISKPGPDMMVGRRLATAYADQYERQYIQVNGSYELLTEEHSYLAVD